MSHAKTVNDSTLIKIHAIVEDIDFRMHGLDRYKLYPTENIYNFLQLDTMTGKIEIVQWSLDDDKEGSATLNEGVEVNRMTRIFFGNYHSEFRPDKNKLYNLVYYNRALTNSELSILINDLE